MSRTKFKVNTLLIANIKNNNIQVKDFRRCEQSTASENKGDFVHRVIFFGELNNYRKL